MASNKYTKGRLTARPGAETSEEGPFAAGTQALQIGHGRDGLLFVPARYRADQPPPLAIMLHGAGGQSQRTLASVEALAEAMGMIVLVPDSRRQTWDVIVGGYGPDIAFLDQALAHVFRRYAVDQNRIAIGGFSDGASYALSVGLTNGDLFTHIIAFSPGFMAPGEQHGAPPIFVSHGTHDDVLPIDICSRRLVPQLQRAGYDVRYDEFDGSHTVPPEIARAALDWFKGTN